MTTNNKDLISVIQSEFTKLSKLEIPDINNFQYQFPENNTYMSALKYFRPEFDSKIVTALPVISPNAMTTEVFVPTNKPSV